MGADKQTTHYKAPVFIIVAIEKMMAERQNSINNIRIIQSEDNRCPDPAIERHKKEISNQIDELQKLLYLIR